MILLLSFNNLLCNFKSNCKTKRAQITDMNTKQEVTKFEKDIVSIKQRLKKLNLSMKTIQHYFIKVKKKVYIKTMSLRL